MRGFDFFMDSTEDRYLELYWKFAPCDSLHASILDMVHPAVFCIPIYMLKSLAIHYVTGIQMPAPNAPIIDLILWKYI